MISVLLPFPPSELNPNKMKGRHWTATYDIKGRYFQECRILTMAAMGKWVPPTGEIALEITFVQPDRRRRDRDNLLAAMKSGLDGLAAALGIDDDEFEPVTIRREYGTKPGAVRVVINGIKGEGE